MMNDLSDKGLGGALKDGRTLFSFLGQFWHGVYEDPDFAEQFCEALGLLSTQLEQKKNEAKAASGRKLLPVYSRERWLCVKLSDVTKNKGKASQVKISETSQAIGDTDTDGNYGCFGPGQLISGVSLYPLPKYVISAESIHERILDPEVTLLSGVDFEIEDDSISFAAGKNPISDSRFKQSQDGDGIVVWLKNALVDKNYVSDYAGYVMGMHLASSRRNLDTINAFWDLINTGATITSLQYFVCKALGVPCIEDTVETVEKIEQDASDWCLVTNKNKYFNKQSFSDRIVVGSVLLHGTPLIDAVRLLEQPTNSDFDDSDPEYCNLGDVLYLKQGFFKDGAVSGLGFGFDEVDLVDCGLDKNGHVKYRFPVYGNSHDADVFFESCWKACEAANIGIASLLGVKDDDSDAVVIPGRFLLDNLIGTNTVFVQIDMSLLDESGLASAYLLSRTFEALPPGVCLMFCMSSGEIKHCISDKLYSSVKPSIAVQITDFVSDSCEISQQVDHFILPGPEKNNPGENQAMRTLSDSYSGISGHVVPFIIKKDGTRKLIAGHHNDILISSRLILSNLLAGAANYAPTHIAFVSSDADLSNSIAENSRYDDLIAGGYVRFSNILTPNVKPDEHAVTFTSHTGYSDSDSVSGFAAKDVKRAILVCKLSSENIIPFSVIDFDFDSPLTLPEGAVFGVYWTISFDPVDDSSSDDDSSSVDDSFVDLDVGE